MDRIEAGSSSKWTRILKGEDNTLPNGWFAVKQPDLQQRENGITREDARSSERSYFDSDPSWSGIGHPHRQRLGTPSLAEHLGEVLSDLVSMRQAE